MTSVVLGASRPEQIEENAGAAGVRLTAETLAAVESAVSAAGAGSGRP